LNELNRYARSEWIMDNRMNETSVSRRAMLAQCGAASVGVLAASELRAAPVEQSAGKQAEATQAARPAIGLCLNTATLRGQKLSLKEEVEIAAKAGYQAIEPWIEEIARYVASGGKLADLKKRIADLGLVVPSAIGFADWINDDDSRRAAGLEQWKRDAELVVGIGGIRMAAPPKGAYNVELDLRGVAGRYRKLLELSVPLGIVPELEMWGGSKTLSRMSQVAYVLVEAAHPQACGLLDVFHIFKGGSDFAGIRVFDGAALGVLHMNDYPAGMTREKGTDADRVYPGLGCAPLVDLVANLNAIRYRGYLSLELFNRDYWKQDGLTVAHEGCRRMREIVRKATEGPHARGERR
jgi:sugar phosphate isomerase/epimerase